jgi:hypothetical protein
VSDRHSASDWANFVKGLDLSLGETLELIDMIHWIYEDGWIQRNKAFCTDTCDHTLRGDWTKSISNVIAEELVS